MLKIYLDNCCYNRPFDDLNQRRIRNEARAVNELLSLSQKGKLIIVSSVFVDIEIERNNNQLKRSKVLKIYRYDEFCPLTQEIERLANIYQGGGLKPFDSLHLASAEANQVDYLLTTDDDYIKIANHFEHNIKVVNPYNFRNEVLRNDI